MSGIESSSVACTHRCRPGSCAGVRLARCPGNAAAHPVVNRVDAGSDRDHLFAVAEGEQQHRVDGRAQPPEAGQQAAAEGAVVVHAGGNRGMRQLKKDGTAPGGDDDHLAVDLPGDAFGAGPGVPRAEQPRAYSPAMSVKCI